MDVKCSFSPSVEGSCSYNPRDRSRSTEVIEKRYCWSQACLINNWRRNRNRTYFGKSAYKLFFGVKSFGINDLSSTQLISWYWVATRIESVPSSSANIKAWWTSPKNRKGRKRSFSNWLEISTTSLKATWKASPSSKSSRPLQKSLKMMQKNGWYDKPLGKFIFPLQRTFVAPNSTCPRQTQFSSQTFFPHDTPWCGRGQKTYKYALTIIDVASRVKEAEPWPRKTLLRLQVFFGEVTLVELWNIHSCFRSTLAENS